MSDITASHAVDPSRRRLLKVGAAGAALLATAGFTATLTGCSSSGPAEGLSVLRRSDLPFLRAVLPVLLEDAAPAERMPAAVDATLRGLDQGLAHFSPAQRKMTLELFDVLSMPVTRGPLTGVWGGWEGARPEDIHAFLERWRTSSIGLLQMGHAALLQLAAIAWYGSTESWAHAGYPGPPRI